MPKVADGEKYFKKYSDGDLQKALNEIRHGQSLREVARKYKIPRATLQFRKSGKFTKASFGPSPVLTNEEESLLVDWIKENARKGFPRRPEDLQLSVKGFLDKVPRQNPFKDNYPHIGWYRAFLRRHPEIATRIPEGVTAASSNVSKSDIKKWFAEIQSYLTEKGYDQILADPSRILNGDETCFNLCPKTSKVLAPKGSRNVYEVEHASSKINITVMFTFSASGLLTPPMIIFPGKRVRADIAQSVPPEWGIGISDSGWMKTELFQDYIVKVLHPFLQKNSIQFPVILFVDGHSTHITYETSEICKKLEIILICLYPNATRILQPADVAAFKPIKTGWKKAVLKWRRDNLNDTLTKNKFAPILYDVIAEYGKESTFRNGFKASGLYPFNPDSIDYSKCLGTRNVIPEEPSATVNYDTFKNIIGADKIHELETTNICGDVSPNFILLHRLWKQFSGPRDDQPKHANASREPIQNDNVNVAKSKNIQEEIELGNAQEGKDSSMDVEEDKLENIQNNYVYESVMPITENEQEFDLENIPIVFEDHSLTDNNEILIEEVEPNIVQGHNQNTQDNVVGILKETLNYAKTPQRKGIRDCERSSFVITSTQWRENKRQQQEDKVKKEKDKEERLRKRKQLQEEKKQLKIEKEKNRKTTRTRKLKKNVENRNVRKKENTIDVHDTSDKEKIFTAEILQSHSTTSVKIKNASRNLFQDDKINIISEIIVKPSMDIAEKPSECENETLDQVLVKIGLSSVVNSIVYSNLCYTCTSNISETNYGIKCSNCRRTYHVKCINKHKLHKSNSEIFHCLSCLKEKSLHVSNPM